MSTHFQLPYRVRWLAASSQGALLGVAMLVFVGVLGVAGALSADSWAIAAILAILATSSSANAISQMHYRVAQFNFIEKSVLLSSCSLIVIGAYSILFQRIHSLRMVLAENPEKMDQLQQIVPDNEAALFNAVLYAFGGLCLLALLLVLVDAAFKKNNGGKPGIAARAALISLLFAVSCLAMMGGRTVYFIMQAVGAAT